MCNVPICRNSLHNVGKSVSRQGKFSQLNEFADRLRATRKRMGLNQADFASLGGVVMNSQNRYEAAATEPSMSYLANLAQSGVDVGYLLSGQVGGGSEDATVAAVLADFIALPDWLQAETARHIAALAAGSGNASHSIHDRRPKYRGEGEGEGTGE